LFSDKYKAYNSGAAKKYIDTANSGQRRELAPCLQRIDRKIFK
jgi:hypothetical protein